MNSDLGINMSRPKLAIIGCGLQVELNHLPALAGLELAEVTLLVDKAVPIAQRLKQKYRTSAMARDYHEVLGEADAAIAALPDYRHALGSTGCGMESIRDIEYSPEREVV